jgi:peptidoglycan/LPS O-acetylase OafA/YrhL
MNPLPKKKVRMSTTSGRNQWLDLWRSVAVTLVVLCHGLELLRNPAVARAQGIFGLVGVEIFFCLSGFLIGTIFIGVTNGYKGSPATLLNFMVRRWMRTLPNYYFYLALNFWFFWIGWTTIKSVDLTPYLFFVQNLMWPHPSFFPEAWSLGVEEVFYLLLPTTFFIVWMVTRKPMTALIATLLTLLTVSMVLRYPIIEANLPADIYVRKISLYRLDSLMWGVALAVLHWHMKGKMKGMLYFLSVGMLCFLYFPVAGFTTGVSWMPSFMFRYLFFPFVSIGICGVLSLGMDVRLPRGVVAVTSRLSKWSYSMYLANMPTYYLFINLIEPNVKFDNRIVEFIFDILVVLAISIITYTCVEKPFLAMRDRLFPDSRTAERPQQAQSAVRSTM